MYSKSCYTLMYAVSVQGMKYEVFQTLYTVAACGIKGVVLSKLVPNCVRKLICTFELEANEIYFSQIKAGIHTMHHLAECVYLC